MKPKQISVTEPVTALQYVPIQENFDPLVDFTSYCPDLLIDTQRFVYQRQNWVRKSVADRLNEATTKVPKGLKLALLEGWRAPHIQLRMYLAVEKMLRERHPEWSDVKLKRKLNQFTAPPHHKKVPPPHTTGGAIDVFLAHPNGKLLNHILPFERNDHRCFPMYAEGLGDEAKETREILRSCLEPTGLTNYPSEYWHWSYGDQGWAYRGGHPHALYDKRLPEGWSPDPAEAILEPLEWVEE